MPPLPMFESGDGFYYNFERLKGDYNTLTVRSDLITSTTLPSSSLFS